MPCILESAGLIGPAEQPRDLGKRGCAVAEEPPERRTMDRSPEDIARLRAGLQQHKADLQKRVTTIHEHARDPLEQDSAEQAAQLGQVAVVSALEDEAIQQIGEIDAALQRIDAGTYGLCFTCGEPISEGRLRVRPAAMQCLDCAEIDGRR
jgi:DnaK suppressor protein